MPSPQRNPFRGTVDGNPVARLATELRSLQVRARKSLKELESEVHVSDSSLSRYFAGRAVPPWSVVQRLSELAGDDATRLRPLWAQANQARRPTGAAAGGAAAQLPPDELADRDVGWPRRHRRLLLVAAFVATAVVFGGGGVLIGREFGTKILTLKPTEDSACRDWPWPANAGQAVAPPVRPQASDHAPTVELIAGKATDGRNAMWARITNAEFGDRVWLDISTDRARSWVQCGPFPVTTSTGTSRAHATGPNMLFRACGDVPTPVPTARGEICTNW